MKKQYIFVIFALCFCVWAIVVDNVVIPRMDRLKRDTGVYSRYRVKEWVGDKKFDLIEDELIIYAHVKKRERMYYIDRSPFFETSLANIEPGSTIQLRYVKAFPKVWKRELYDLQVDGVSVMRYSPGQLVERQRFIWKFTGVMAGAFVALSALGFINKPRKK